MSKLLRLVISPDWLGRSDKIVRLRAWRRRDKSPAETKSRRSYGAIVRRVVPSRRRISRPTMRKRGAPRAVSLLWRLTSAGSRPGRPRGLLAAIPHFERILIWRRGRQKIPGRHRGMLGYRLCDYRGAALQLPDGTTLIPGDSIGDIHCNNGAMSELTQTGVNPYIEARLELRLLAQWLSTSDPGARIKALHAFSLISPAAARLGFFVLDGHTGFRAHLEQWFMTGLLMVHTPEGIGRLHRGSAIRRVPREAWLTRRRLDQVYGPQQFPASAAQAAASAAPG